MQAKHKTTIIFITHDLNEALTLGDRVAVMKDGRFSQVGTPPEIVLSPADDYVSAFTREIDRARVLPVSTALRGSTVEVTADLPEVHADVLLASVLDQLGQGPVRVMGRDGTPRGVVTAADAAAIAAPPGKG